MNLDDEISNEPLEVGSDELLSDNNLRLPESANILVRVHAVQAWLTRRYQETTLEVGEAALALQELVQCGRQESASGHIPRLQALTDVQHRVERVGVPHEEEDE